jgi:uncharacterized membrane protein
MQDFIYFLGRFHVLALHLPIGIVIAAVALDWTARRPAYERLAAVSPFLWGAAAASAVLTVALGYMHFAEGAFTGPSATAHRLWGTVTAVATILIWWLSRRPELYKRVNIVSGVAALALISITGHYGGNLTHGASFLWQYAPGPLRSLGGAAPTRPAVTSVGQADPYHDVVRPMLELRCGGCHNNDKRESGYTMATYESTLKGGDTGGAIVPGKSDSSEVYRRISLAPDDEEFMPADDKTPLTNAQVEIMRWWIDAGAPRDTTVAQVGADDEIQSLLAAELGLAGATSASLSAQTAVPADPAVVDRLYRSGFLVRQVSQSDPHLVVSVYSPGARVIAEHIAVLLTAADRIVELNLQDAGLDDETLAGIGQFTGLTRLRLSRNEITDRTVEEFTKMPRLERLNLYANPGVTDDSVDVLASLRSLRRLDVWQTNISPEGLTRLRALRPELELQAEANGVFNGVELPDPAGADWEVELP